MAEQKRRHLRDTNAGPPPETFAQVSPCPMSEDVGRADL